MLWVTCTAAALWLPPPWLSLIKSAGGYKDLLSKGCFTVSQLNEIDAHRQRERGQRRGSDGLEQGKGKDTQRASFLFSAARYTVHCIITRFKCDCRLNPKVISQNKPASAELILAWLRIPKRSVKL